MDRNIEDVNPFSSNMREEWIRHEYIITLTIMSRANGTIMLFVFLSTCHFITGISVIVTMYPYNISCSPIKEANIGYVLQDVKFAHVTPHSPPPKKIYLGSYCKSV